jgi:hypothetical protein
MYQRLNEPPPKHTCVVEKPRKRKPLPTSESYYHCDNHKKSSDLFFNTPAPPQPQLFWKMTK